MDTITNEDCEVWLKPKYGRHISDKMMCAYGTVKTRAHQNDAGYPLVWNNQLIGIAISEHSCGAGRPDVFTRISSYKDWVENIIGAEVQLDAKDSESHDLQSRMNSLQW